MRFAKQFARQDSSGLSNMTLDYGIVCGTRLFFYRYSSQHRKYFFRRDYTLRSNKGAPVKLSRDPTPRWIQYRILRCWHCACVIRFDDKREAGCLNCLCDFCPRLKSKHYFRAGSCRPSQGLCMWDGPWNVRSCNKKTVRLHAIHEVGGQIVRVKLTLGDRI